MAAVKVVSQRPSEVNRRFRRPLRLLMLLVTLWPLVYLGLFMFVWFRLFFGIMAPGSDPLSNFPVAFIVARLATMLLSFALLACYVVHLFRNARFDGNMKAVWAIVLFMGGMIAMPIYWYLYIWQDAAPVSAAVQGT